MRNRRDGSVEAMVCGTDDAIAAIIAWARTGPRFSKVERVLVENDQVITSVGFTVIFTE